MGFLEDILEILYGLLKLASVLSGAGQVYGTLNPCLLHGTDFVHRELEAVVEFVEQTANLYEVILLKAVDMVGNVVPHLGVKMAAAVCQCQCQIKLAALFWLGLF